MMRVAQYLSQYPGRDGTSAYGTGLSKAMNLLWPGSCPVISNRADHREAPEGVEVLRYPSHTTRPGALPPDMISDLVDGKLELNGVVIHGVFNPRAVALAGKLRKNGIPYAFMPHDPYVSGLLKHGYLKKSLFLRLFEQPMIRRAKGVILLAESHEKYLRNLGYKGAVKIVPNGCDPESLPLNAGNMVTPGHNEVAKILYLGRMDRNHKGLDLLLQGFAKFLAGRNPAVELILTGNDWEDRQELEKLSTKLGIGNFVQFTGPRSENSIQIHGEADVVILPSRFDGFGLTIVEAMLASRPVMVSKEAGIASHVERSGGGIIFEPGVDAIASAFVELLGKREDWEKMGKENHLYVIENLTWEATARETMRAYSDFFC